MNGDLEVLVHMSLPFGSTSPDLGDMWKYGCPKSPDWDDIGVWAGSEGIDEDIEEITEVNTKGLAKSWEGPWEAMWPFLDPWDVVVMRTTASSWNIPSKHGPHGELFFFLIKKEPT